MSTYKRKPCNGPGQGGRKGYFRPEMTKQAYKLCLMGATSRQLADFFEVKEIVIEDWIRHNEEFGDAVRAGKMEADSEVAFNLWRRTQDRWVSDELIVQDREGKIKRKEVNRHLILGDVGAQKHWLAMRQKALWADTKIDINIHQRVDIRMISEGLQDVSQLSMEELQTALKLSVKKAIEVQKELPQNALPKAGTN